MALKPAESYPAGGVDSRSNPIIEPADRCLEVHDFWPQQDGSFRLRDGYKLLVPGVLGNTPIHSVIGVNSAVQQNFSTLTTTIVSAAGSQNVKVSSLAGIIPGEFANIDSGANLERILVYAINATGPFSPGVVATFSKTHVANVPFVSAPVPSTPLVLFWQDRTPYILNQTVNQVYSPPIKGAAIQSSSRFSYFYANGHLHAFNGTDAKWFDGYYWRDIGLPTLTAAQAAAILITPGDSAITPVQAAAVGLSAVGGGHWSGTTSVSAFFAFFDTANNTLSASATPLGSGPVSVGAGQKISLTSLPVSPISTVVGLLGFQQASDPGAAFATPYGAAVPVNRISSVSVTGTVVRIGLTSHGLATGQVITLNQSGLTTIPSLGPFAVTVIDANNFSFTTPNASLYTLAQLNGGAITILVVVPHGTTTGSIDQSGTPGQGTSFNSSGQNLLPYLNDTTQITGLPASSIGGAQPGYQFYASIYNLVTGHVGNRIALGFRLNNTAPLASIIFSGCPVFTDTEWVLLLGRTGDGAEIPYAIVDSNANWQYVPNGKTTLTLSPFGIDGNSELPSRNYPPPGTLDYNYQLSLLPGGAAQNPPIAGTFQFAWVESDHCCGVLSASPTVYRSGSALDFREGQFVGLPEQSWDPGDIETFPTNNPIIAGHGYQQESHCFSSEDCSILIELNGETSWQGPYNVGIAGQHAWARGWQNLPFWVTGDKQLATISQGGWQQLAGMTSSANAGPIPISGEYEAALLSQIGDAYLSQTEVSYIRKPLEMVDVLRIKCFDANGKPFTIIHDFNLRDERSPYGQAYEEVFGDALALPFTQAAVRDANLKSQIVCGGSDGNLYLLYSGGNDNGKEFTAQALRLVNIGPQRTAVKELRWYGDGKAQWYITRKLSAAFNIMQMDNLCGAAPQEVQGEESDNFWSVPLPKPEMIHAYLLLQLTSHSADGTTALNSPPHMPVESYGRIWLVSPQLGAARP